MARRTYALFARSTFHDAVVDERMVHAGVPLEVGPKAGPSVPLPEGTSWLARALWTSESTVAVSDSSGAVHHLEPGRDVVVEIGPVSVRMYLAEQFPLVRAEPWSLRGSVAWLAVVVMVSVISGQAMWLGENQCALAMTLLPDVGDIGVPVLLVAAPLAAFAIALFVLITSENTRRAMPALALPLLSLFVPLIYGVSGMRWKSGADLLGEEFAFCMPPHADAGGGSPMSAEYLARLLRNDTDGEDEGVIEHEIERPTADRKTEKPNQFYMPAGAEGPATRMGGAATTAPTPVRTMSKEDKVALPAERSPSEEAAEKGPEIQQLEAAGKDDAVAEGLEVKPSDEQKGEQAAAEEQEGWGFRSWYDEEDAAMDNLEIEVMLRAAKGRLRIDPDDAAALSILSYYQYLAQDFDAAKKTYDRFIELFPDDAAGYNNKALVYKRLGEYQKEESLYRVALGLSPDDVTALNNLGVNLSHQKRFDEALKVMESLEVLDPKDPYAELHRSKIYAEMGNDEEALRHLELALEGMEQLDTLHHIEFRQDIRLDPSFAKLREGFRFRAILDRYYGKDSPLEE